MKQMRKFVISHLKRAPEDPSASVEVPKLGNFLRPSNLVGLSGSTLTTHTEHGAKKKGVSGPRGNDDLVHWLFDTPEICIPARDVHMAMFS